ncbi:hypothetical protein Scep_004802 [Stephania cephalantha]|uniref:Uncharacterized protein n=1 Tax=Stephania cephalantha TaxID=152367 RepID=A0AAP0PVR6_9MAGN
MTLSSSRPTTPRTWSPTVKSVLFMSGQVNGQYIIKGLSSRFMRIMEKWAGVFCFTTDWNSKSHRNVCTYITFDVRDRVLSIRLDMRVDAGSDPKKQCIRSDSREKGKKFKASPTFDAIQCRVRITRKTIKPTEGVDVAPRSTAARVIALLAGLSRGVQRWLKSGDSGFSFHLLVLLGGLEEIVATLA